MKAESVGGSVTVSLHVRRFTTADALIPTANNHGAMATMPYPRPIAPEEIDVLRTTLRRGARKPLAASIFEGIEHRQVIGGCACGCATFDFTDEWREGFTVIAEADGVDEQGEYVGVIVWGSPDTLKGVEIHGVQDNPPLPIAKTLVRSGCAVNAHPAPFEEISIGLEGHLVFATDIGMRTPFAERQPCNCCGYPSVPKPGAYFICPLCWWEQDIEDPSSPDDVVGGANGPYSLRRARKNFRDHLTMYDDGRDTRIGGEDPPHVRELKTKLMLAYDRALSAPSSEEMSSRWKDVQKLERQLFQQDSERASR
jgi:hypothetical protein